MNVGLTQSPACVRPRGPHLRAHISARAESLAANCLDEGNDNDIDYLQVFM